MSYPSEARRDWRLLGLSVRKVQIEIYESDPFSATCCTRPRSVSDQEADDFRNELIRRSRIVKEVLSDRSDFADVRRDIFTPSRQAYPPYVRKAIAEGRPFPLVFADGELVSCGKFPKHGDLILLIDRLPGSRR